MQGSAGDLVPDGPRRDRPSRFSIPRPPCLLRAQNQRQGGLGRAWLALARIGREARPGPLLRRREVVQVSSGRGPRGRAVGDPGGRVVWGRVEPAGDPLTTRTRALTRRESCHALRSPGHLSLCRAEPDVAGRWGLKAPRSAGDGPRQPAPPPAGASRRTRAARAFLACRGSTRQAGPRGCSPPSSGPGPGTRASS